MEGAKIVESQSGDDDVCYRQRMEKTIDKGHKSKEEHYFWGLPKEIPLILLFNIPYKPHNDIPSWSPTIAEPFLSNMVDLGACITRPEKFYLNGWFCDEDRCTKKIADDNEICTVKSLCNKTYIRNFVYYVYLIYFYWKSNKNHISEISIAISKGNYQADWTG